MTDFGPLVSGEEAASLREGATPGPWTTDAEYVVAEIPSGRPGGEVIIQCRPTLRHAVTPERANAALVAAAPRLAYTVEVAARVEKRRQDGWVPEFEYADEGAWSWERTRLREQFRPRRGPEPRCLTR